VLAEASRSILDGARTYWQRRIASHLLVSLFLLVAFVVVGLWLLTSARREWALLWLIAFVSLVVGDVFALIRIARCAHCGILISPSPSYRTACPRCGHIVQP
jgi:hypothetical protein